MFSGRDFSTSTAWIVLILSTVTIGGACLGLAHSVEATAVALDIPLYFVAVILAAGATSVPDTVISVRDALKGEYDDAIANAVGSNTFDICVALGLPLMLYCLLNGTDVSLIGEANGEVQGLRIFLIIVSVVVLGLLLVLPSIGKGTALIFAVLYMVWTGYIIMEAKNQDQLSSNNTTPAITAPVQTPPAQTPPVNSGKQDSKPN